MPFTKALVAAAVPGLAAAVSEAAAALGHAPTHTARELSKFAVQQGAFELKFAGVDAFAKGLDALVGLPSPQAHITLHSSLHPTSYIHPPSPGARRDGTRTSRRGAF